MKISHFVYQTFGLKKEWIDLFFLYKFDVFQKGGFGPNQIIALKNYLKHCELIKNKLQFTDFYYHILPIREKIEFWELIWINLNFNSKLFIWYSHLNNVSFTRKELIEIAIKDYERHSKSIYNGINCIISTLEYTPFGRELKLGIVTRVKKNKRVVEKKGGHNFNPYVILYGLYKYAEKTSLFEFDLNEITKDNFSMQKILNISSFSISNRLYSIESKLPKDILTIKKFYIKLNQNIAPNYIITLMDT